jgi:hypothetical protein
MFQLRGLGAIDTGEQHPRPDLPGQGGNPMPTGGGSGLPTAIWRGVYQQPPYRTWQRAAAYGAPGAPIVLPGLPQPTGNCPAGQIPGANGCQLADQCDPSEGGSPDQCAAIGGTWPVSVQQPQPGTTVSVGVSPEAAYALTPWYKTPTLWWVLGGVGVLAVVGAVVMARR